MLESEKSLKNYNVQLANKLPVNGASDSNTVLECMMDRDKQEELREAFHEEGGRSQQKRAPSK